MDNSFVEHDYRATRPALRDRGVVYDGTGDSTV
jgi:hypothetical protein